MKKIRPLNYILRVLLFLVLAGLGFHYVNRVLTAKDPEELSAYYYDYPKGSFDVIIAGPSVMKNAVQPVQLWQDYGIRAYNLSCGNQSLSCSYYILKDAIDRDHPSLVVLDVTYAEEIYVTRSKNFVHYLTDVMPLTDTYRYQMIQEVVQPQDRIEFYFPFIPSIPAGRRLPHPTFKTATIKNIHWALLPTPGRSATTPYLFSAMTLIRLLAMFHGSIWRKLLLFAKRQIQSFCSPAALSAPQTATVMKGALIHAAL